MNSRSTDMPFAELEARVLTLHGRDWLKMPAWRREQTVEHCFQYWRARGFPHYRLSRAEMAQDFLNLVAFDVSDARGEWLKASPLALRTANHFHPHMWRVPMVGVRSPLERFADDRILRNVIRKALRLFTERPAVNAPNLRRMLQTYSRTARVSNFSPTVAKAIYARYSSTGDPVLDFSAGFGGRLLGCIALPRQYAGIDPCRAQVHGLRRMLTEFNALGIAVGKASIFRACAEDLLPVLPACSYPLVFTSPPYFDRERYSTEPTQSCIRFPTYPEWLRGFLRPVIRQAHRVLEGGGHFVINVANTNGYPVADDTLQIARREFVHAATLELHQSQRPYLRSSRGEAHRREPVFVFRKRTSRRPKAR